MSEVRIAAEPRTEFGKGAARRIRRDAKVPAVLYGHGSEPRHIALPGHELMLALKTPNVLLSLDLEGGSELALPKDVQRDPIRGHLEHVDLVLVRRGERVVVDLPVHVTGEAVPGALVNLDTSSVQVEAEATHLPEAVEVDLGALAVGDQVSAGDLRLPEGTTLVTDPATLVVALAAAPSSEEVEAELAEAEAEAGIVHEAPTEPAADTDATPSEDPAPSEDAG